MYYSDKTLVFLDGSFIPATDARMSLWSQTVHYGTGVFEGIRSYASKEGVHTFKAVQHLDRLLKGAETLGMKISWSAIELNEICQELLRINALKSAYIRPLIVAPENLTLSAGKKAHIFIAAWSWPRLLGNKQIRTTLHTADFHQPSGLLNESKISGLYVSSVLATTNARKRGFDEAIICNINDLVLRGSATNIFIEKKGVLYTPPKSQVFPGITRETVFELAAELGISVKEGSLHREELLSADSAFLCGTATEIVGIQSIDDFNLPQSWEDSAGYWIFQKYKRRVVSNEYHNYLLL